MNLEFQLLSSNITPSRKEELTTALNNIPHLVLLAEGDLEGETVMVWPATWPSHSFTKAKGFLQRLKVAVRSTMQKDAFPIGCLKCEVGISSQRQWHL